MRISSTAKLRQCNPSPRVLDPEEEEIAAAWADAVRQLPVKLVADAAGGEHAEDAVKAWRAERSTPSIARAVRIGRRVPLLAGATVELLLQRDRIGPEPHRVIGFLLGELSAIASGPNELAAARARSALAAFAKVVAS